MLGPCSLWGVNGLSTPFFAPGSHLSVGEDCLERSWLVLHLRVAVGKFQGKLQAVVQQTLLGLFFPQGVVARGGLCLKKDVHRGDRNRSPILRRCIARKQAVD